MLNVNQDYYRLFYYVCRYRSLTKAANILQMSQPNMTRGLNRLEAQLGCKLLVRSTRGVTLTPEARPCTPTLPSLRNSFWLGKTNWRASPRCKPAA